MISFAIRRILQFIPTILAISLILFLLLNILPGDAALMSAGAQDKGVDPRYLEEMKKLWGLDQPLHLRYLTYLKNLAVGDLGLSYLRREKVSALIASRIWPTVKLALVAMLIAAGIGIPLGFFSALRQGTWVDAFSMIGAVSGVSIPQFWLGLLLMFFLSVKLPFFPASGYGDGDGEAHSSSRFYPGGRLHGPAGKDHAGGRRGDPLDGLHPHGPGKGALGTQGEPEARAAQRLDPGFDHGGPAIRLPHGQHGDRGKALFLAGNRLADGGFHFQRDIPITQGCVLLIILVFLLVNLMVDLLYAVIDPRVEYR